MLAFQGERTKNFKSLPPRKHYGQQPGGEDDDEYLPSRATKLQRRDQHLPASVQRPAPGYRSPQPLRAVAGGGHNYSTTRTESRDAQQLERRIAEMLALEENHPLTEQLTRPSAFWALPHAEYAMGALTVTSTIKAPLLTSEAEFDRLYVMKCIRRSSRVDI